MKAFIFIAALFAFASCQDSASTPNILIGNWALNMTNVTSTSDCCLPAGTMTIINNGNNSVTMTASSWAGELCASGDSSYSLTINGVDGSDSWAELTAASGEPFIAFGNSQGDDFGAIVEFADGLDAMLINVNDNLACSSLYIKTSNSANFLALASAGLATIMALLLI